MCEKGVDSGLSHCESNYQFLQQKFPGCLIPKCDCDIDLQILLSLSLTSFWELNSKVHDRNPRTTDELKAQNFVSKHLTTGDVSKNNGNAAKSKILLRTIKAATCLMWH